MSEIKVCDCPEGLCYHEDKPASERCRRLVNSPPQTVEGEALDLLFESHCYNGTDFDYIRSPFGRKVHDCLVAGGLIDDNGIILAGEKDDGTDGV